MARALVVIFGILLKLSSVASADLPRYSFSEPHMGTLVRITVFASDEPTAERVASQAFDRIAELNGILSDYDPESELSRLSREPSGTPVPVSEDLFTVLQRAQEISECSGGAFDSTVGAVGQLWREARRSEKLPLRSAVSQLLEKAGYQALVFDRCQQTVTLRKPGMSLDLGGIAKGYAASEALRILRAAGVPSSLVAVSGDLAIGEAPPGEDGWRIGISSIEPGAIEQVLLLQNVSVSTSGDTEQFVEIDGIRYSHILDPKTGMGLSQRIAVTTIAQDGATADALATAISVLGVEKGLALVEEIDGAEALILIATPDGKEGFSSSRFPASRLK